MSPTTTILVLLVASELPPANLLYLEVPVARPCST